MSRQGQAQGLGQGLGQGLVQGLGQSQYFAQNLSLGLGSPQTQNYSYNINQGQTYQFDQQKPTNNEMKSQNAQFTSNQPLKDQEKDNIEIQKFSINTTKQTDPFIDLSTQAILELIQKYKLHYDPQYTRIYGIVYDVEYLKNVKDNFEIAYKSLIEYLKKNDRLTRWYEKEIKEFHQQYGIPCILNQSWINFTQSLSILSIYCCITLHHSDPLINMTYLRELYQDKILQYINLKQDQQEQQLLKEFLIQLEKRQEVNINSIKVLSLITNLNIMVHQDMIPSQNPKLISNGEDVYKDDFPKYNILQLFTLDQKQYYQISLKFERIIHQ